MPTVIQSAFRQGQIHFSCTHPAPVDYTPEQREAYSRGQEDGLKAWEDHCNGTLRSEY